ncbi:hypothetical protein WH47_08613 [Habropoda laboriosa]|uniref:Uncharacterized protein n=1 Tax=Habropoda laboriosa TaxID=597456 RepID=A0A0L7QPL2_9HYME|nr:hypothetical protein WH47_08613 [Habropoda laboriosa]
MVVKMVMTRSNHLGKEESVVVDEVTRSFRCVGRALRFCTGLCRDQAIGWCDILFLISSGRCCETMLVLIEEENVQENRRVRTRIIFLYEVFGWFDRVMNIVSEGFRNF